MTIISRLNTADIHAILHYVAQALAYFNTRFHKKSQRLFKYLPFTISISPSQ